MSERMRHAILDKKNKLSIAYWKRPISKEEMCMFDFVQKLLDELLKEAEDGK